MKKLFTLVIAISLISSVSFAQQRIADKDGNFENVIRVKISEKAVIQFEAEQNK